MAEITREDMIRCYAAVLDRMAATPLESGLAPYFQVVGVDPDAIGDVAISLGEIEAAENVGAGLPLSHRLAIVAATALAIGIEAQRDRELRTATEER